MGILLPYGKEDLPRARELQSPTLWIASIARLFARRYEMSQCSQHVDCLLWKWKPWDACKVILEHAEEKHTNTTDKEIM